MEVEHFFSGRYTLIVYVYRSEKVPESRPAKIIARENFCVDRREPTAIRRGTLELTGACGIWE